MKHLLIIVLTAALALGLYGCGKEKAPEEVTAAPAEAQITALQYSDGNVTARFSCQEGVWTWTDGPGFPLDGEKLAQLLQELKQLLQAERVGALDDPALYGLDSAQKYFLLSTQETAIRLTVGKQDADGSWYMSRDDRPEDLYRMSDALVQQLSVGVFDMALLPTMPALTAENLFSVTLNRGDIHRALFYKEGKWISGGQELPDGGLTEALGRLAVTRCVDYAPAAGAAALCGLDDPLNIVVTYVNSVGAQADLVLHVGNASEDSRYVTLGEESTIYLMSQEALAPLLKLADLLVAEPAEPAEPAA